MVGKKFFVCGLLMLSLNVNAEPMSCELFQSMAVHLGKQAYDESKNHIELIDQVGLFDTWIMITNTLLEHYKNPNDKEFVATVKIAQKTMIENKGELVGKVSQDAYSLLLGRVTLRTCQYVEKQGWRR